MKTLHDTFIGDYPISQTFGVNYETYKWIKDYKGNPIKGHNGVDWALPTGTILLNPFPQGNNVVVSFVGWDEKGYGNWIRVWDKTQRCVALFAHLSSVSVDQGEKLLFQQELGKSGNTGWSTGPHLHFAFYEVDDEGNKLNRDNGFDGYLHPMSGVIEWKILNPTKPGEKPQEETPLQACLRQHGGLVTEIDNLKRTLALTQQDAESKKVTITSLKNDIIAYQDKIKLIEDRNKKLETFAQGVKTLSAGI